MVLYSSQELDAEANNTGPITQSTYRRKLPVLRCAAQFQSSVSNGSSDSQLLNIGVLDRERLKLVKWSDELVFVRFSQRVL